MVVSAGDTAVPVTPNDEEVRERYRRLVTAKQFSATARDLARDIDESFGAGYAAYALTLWMAIVPSKEPGRKWLREGVASLKKKWEQAVVSKKKVKDDLEAALKLVREVEETLLRTGTHPGGQANLSASQSLGNLIEAYDFHQEREPNRLEIDLDRIIGMSQAGRRKDDRRAVAIRFLAQLLKELYRGQRTSKRRPLWKEKMEIFLGLRARTKIPLDRVLRMISGEDLRTLMRKRDDILRARGMEYSGLCRELTELSGSLPDNRAQRVERATKALAKLVRSGGKSDTGKKGDAPGRDGYQAAVRRDEELAKGIALTDLNEAVRRYFTSRRDRGHLPLPSFSNLLRVALDYEKQHRENDSNVTAYAVVCEELGRLEPLLWGLDPLARDPIPGPRTTQREHKKG